MFIAKAFSSNTEASLTSLCKACNVDLAFLKPEQKVFFVWRYEPLGYFWLILLALVLNLFGHQPSFQLFQCLSCEQVWLLRVHWTNWSLLYKQQQQQRQVVQQQQQQQQQQQTAASTLVVSGGGLRQQSAVAVIRGHIPPGLSPQQQLQWLQQQRHQQQIVLQQNSQLRQQV